VAAQERCFRPVVLIDEINTSLASAVGLAAAYRWVSAHLTGMRAAIADLEYPLVMAAQSCRSSRQFASGSGCASWDRCASAHQGIVPW
jgi:hypothetical protein